MTWWSYALMWALWGAASEVQYTLEDHFETPDDWRTFRWELIQFEVEIEKRGYWQ